MVRKRLAKAPCCDRSKAALDGSKVESNCAHDPRAKVRGPSSCGAGAGAPSQSSWGGVKAKEGHLRDLGTQGHGGKLAPHAASADEGEADNLPKMPNTLRQKCEQQTANQGHRATRATGRSFEPGKVVDTKKDRESRQNSRVMDSAITDGGSIRRRSWHPSHA